MKLPTMTLASEFDQGTGPSFAGRGPNRLRRQERSPTIEAVFRDPVSQTMERLRQLRSQNSRPGNDQQKFFGSAHS